MWYYQKRKEVIYSQGVLCKMVARKCIRVIDTLTDFERKVVNHWKEHLNKLEKEREITSCHDHGTACIRQCKCGRPIQSQFLSEKGEFKCDNCAHVVKDILRIQ